MSRTSRRQIRMSALEKTEVLARVASSGLPKRKALGELGVPKSTYYRWLRRKDQQGLEDDAGGGKPPWNRLTAWEVDNVLSAAREMPELSCRQLAPWATDNMGFSVSESTVYRILRREGLVKKPEMRLVAGKEYHRKTGGGGVYNCIYAFPKHRDWSGFPEMGPSPSRWLLSLTVQAKRAFANRG